MSILHLGCMISTAQLSTDTATVILEMQIPFGTGDTPFVEQIGSINDTFGNVLQYKVPWQMIRHLPHSYLLFQQAQVQHNCHV